MRYSAACCGVGFNGIDDYPVEDEIYCYKCGSIWKGHYMNRHGFPTLDQWTKNTIVTRLKYFKGHVGKTAISLGVGRSTLYKWINKYKINTYEFRRKFNGFGRQPDECNSAGQRQD